MPTTTRTLRTPVNFCREYDHAAVVRLVNNEPEWDTTPPRIHVYAGVAEDEVLGEFLRTAYRLSTGCRPEVLHGDLTEPETDQPEEP